MIFKMTILLDTVEKIKAFTTVASRYDADFDIRAGRCLIDGKSLMGILALNTASPHELIVNCKGNGDYIEELHTAMSKFEYRGR